MNEHLNLDPLYWLLYAANCAPYAGALYLGYKLCHFIAGGIDAKLTAWRYQGRMTRPDANGLYPISSDALLNIADPERLIALAQALIESRRTHPNVPLTLTYSPHTSQDRALDVNVTPGMGATGGGSFQLFDNAQDRRFTALPESMSIPVDLGQEADCARVHATG